VLWIFSINRTKLAEAMEQQFPLESEIQRLTEANLHDLFDLDLVKSEFELHGLRIDTLAFDSESKAFVIIEYKKDRKLWTKVWLILILCSTIKLILS
jgi:RecB family endonuclease NucS